MVINELIIKYIKKDYKEEKHKLLEKSVSIKPSISNKKIFVSKQRTFNNNSNISLTNLNTYKTIKANETISEGLQNLTIKEKNEENEDLIAFTNIDIDKHFTNEEFIKKMSKIYKGYNPDLNFTRVLLISHSGFIMELLNSIRIRKNIRIKFINDSKQTSLYILKIYCLNCGSICYSKNSSCKLDFDMIIYNNIDHLNLI